MLGLVTLCLFLAVSAGPVVLNAETFESTVVSGGKNAFVKFYAPWCGHCKAMAPAWGQLGDEYSGSSSVVIGDVDCTEQQDLCSKHGVSGYPTLKYWKDGEKHDYSGGRDFEGLKSFVVDNLQVLCNVENPVDCNDKEKAFLESMKAKPDQVATQLTRLQSMQGSKVAPALKGWINQRINILNQLSKASKGDL